MNLDKKVNYDRLIDEVNIYQAVSEFSPVLIEKWAHTSSRSHHEMRHSLHNLNSQRSTIQKENTSKKPIKIKLNKQLIATRCFRMFSKDCLTIYDSRSLKISFTYEGEKCFPYFQSQWNGITHFWNPILFSIGIQNSHALSRLMKFSIESKHYAGL